MNLPSLPETLKTYKERIEDIRNNAVQPESDSPVALREAIVRYRSAQDQLEKLVADLGTVKSRLEVAATEAQNAFDDRWRQAMEQSHTGEYSSAQERNAAYTGEAFDELVALRKLKRALADAKEVHDYAVFRYRGLDGARRDIDARIRLLNVEAVLER